MTTPYIPAGEPGDVEGEGTNFTTLDDIAERHGSPDPTAPTPPDLSVKLDGDTVPEQFRGLTLEQMLQRAVGQTEVIKNLRGNAPAPAPAAPAAPAPTERQAIPTIDPEKFQQLFEEKPIEALGQLTATIEARLQRQFEDRLSGLMGNIGGTVEHQMAQRFPEEFKVLGAEIKELASQLPEAARANPVAWEDLVRYAKGRYEDKWFEHKVAKRGEAAPTTHPRDTAAAETFYDVPAAIPRSPTNGRAPAPKGGYTGPITKQMRDEMEVMGLSEAEFRKFYV